MAFEIASSLTDNKTLQEALARPEVVKVCSLSDLDNERSTSGNLTFRFNQDEGLELPTGKRIIVVLNPAEQAQLPRYIQAMFLGHRKDQKYWHLEEGSEYDPNGAYTQVSIFDGKTNKWVAWKDAKGYDPVKYAERRKSIEYEMLGDIHFSLGEIEPLAISLTSKGKGNPAKSVVTVHDLSIMLRPEITEEIEEVGKIFTPGTRFPDYSKPSGTLQAITVYGGGKAKYPKGEQQIAHTITGYPNAVPIGKRTVNDTTKFGPTGHEPFTMTTNFNSSEEALVDGKYTKTLEPGTSIKGLEIAIGARWWDGTAPHQDLNCSGGRKVSTYICNASGEKINDLIMRYNVGPTGTLLGSLSDPSYITKPGDCLVIEGENHVSYLMGYRMFVKKNTPKPSGVTATGVGAQFKKWLGTAIGSGTAPQAVSAPAPAAPAAPNSTTSASAFDLAPTGQEAGGTQGGQWYVDKSTGTKYFAKTYEQAGPQANDRRASEFIANSFYRLMGVPAPQSHLFKGMILSQEIPKGKSHYFSGPTKQSQANTTFGSHPDILNGFIVDAWLANWDIFGLNYDNIVASEGRCYRVDNGGAMFFRGMGAPKPSFANAQVSEIDTMRNPDIAKEAGSIFSKLSPADIKAQAQKLKSTFTDEVIKSTIESSGIANAPHIISTLIKRRNQIVATYA